MSIAPHTPVMLNEVLATLAPKEGEIYVDGTFGAGGYSRALLEAAQCRVYAFDRDASVAPIAEALQAEHGDRLVFIVGCFSDMCALLAEHGVTKVDGIVLDIGVSSMQLDQAERGFSFSKDGPLDMRMAQQGMSAADIVNNAEESELADIIYTYGEETASRRIARAIVKARSEAPITTTKMLADIVARVVKKTGRTHPATRTFQALRMQVNDELGELQRALEASEQLLKPGGRLVVVTFHSLEDRLVKQFTHSRCGKILKVSRHLPMGISHAEENAAPVFFTLPRRSKQKASREETVHNPRARTATLRVAVRTSYSAGGEA